ncbi:MAG: hypothetical protein KF757_04650 [Phycisphaeraceae bacterium]|nr:hypothetical protein [Phycisphaeraceae bacterium]MCW5764261.1 hypothetical protein [Phycisphaeraceae bacterium]
MIAQARTAIIVTIVTLLVWVLAEGQTLRVTVAAAELTLDAGSASRVVRWDPAERFSGRVELRFSGSARRIDEISRRIRSPIALAAGTEFAAGSGVQVVDLREALRRTDIFQAAGAALLDVEPRLVRIEVDELVPIDIPVRITIEGAAVEGEPRAEPELIRYEVPAAALAAINRDDLFATVRLTEAEVSGLPAGTQSRLPNLRITLSPAMNNFWSRTGGRNTVDVTLTLRSRLTTLVLPTVPVHVQAAPAEMLRFDVMIAEDDLFIADVTLRGPAALIERINNDPALRPVAVVSLGFEELERGIDSKAAVLRMPPGFEAVEARAENLIVGLTITRRERPTPTDE